MKRVTIKDIARMANVSAATVSMVLNGKTNISAATRERVMALAKQHNYVPNVSARGLVSARTGSIGIIIPDLVEPFNAATLRAISAGIWSADYKVVLYDTHDYTALSAAMYNQISHESRVDGIIHKALDLSDKDRSLVQGLRVPLVVFENELRWVDCVSVNNRDGAYSATKYLLNKGHKQIGVISCRLAQRVVRARMRGVRAALADAGLKLDPAAVYSTNAFTAREGLKAADYFHHLARKPSAIFSIAGDYVACGFLARSKKLGYRIPDDFAVVGFDDLEISEYLDPQLTTVRQPLEKMAAAARDLLIARILERGKPFEQRVFDTEFVIRESA